MSQKITIVGYNNDTENPLVTEDEVREALDELDLSTVFISIEEM